MIIPLNAHDAESVKQAFHTFGVLCKTMASASQARIGQSRFTLQQAFLTYGDGSV